MDPIDELEATPSSASTSLLASCSDDSGDEAVLEQSVGLKRKRSCIDIGDDDDDDAERSTGPVGRLNRILDDEWVNDPDLTGIRQLIFLDIDNWKTFFYKLPAVIPHETFVWGFYGIQSNWKEPVDCHVYTDAKQRGIVFINPPCLFRKDAADFAICMQVGRMSEKLAIDVAFIILSGDNGFQELCNQLYLRSRWIRVINPHGKSNSYIYTLLQSVVDN